MPWVIKMFWYALNTLDILLLKLFCNNHAVLEISGVACATPRGNLPLNSLFQHSNLGLLAYAKASG